MAKTRLKDQTSNIAFHGHGHAVALTDVRLSGQNSQDAHTDNLA